MAGTYAIACLICGAEHRYNILPGERRTYDYPGHGPEVDWVVDGCECYENSLVRQAEYAEEMDRAALEHAQSEYDARLTDRYDTHERV